MDDWLKNNLVCPRDYKDLLWKDDTLNCPLGHSYPYINGIPIMLLRETKPTHRAFRETLEQINGDQVLCQLYKEKIEQNTVDPFVQQAIAGTCGIMYRRLINKLDRYPIPDLPLPKASGLHLLDIGCNWGRWCIAASKKGYNVVGIDLSLDAIMAACRIARQLKISASYLVADARYLPFREKSFDIVFSYSLLQHFDESDVQLALYSIARVLKSSGISLIQMPNIFGLRNLYNQFRRGFKRPTAFEVRYWSLPKLKNTFSNSIGPTSLFIDGYFSLNAQITDIRILPLRYKLVILSSNILRRLGRKMPWMKYFADSLYVKSIRQRL